MKNSVLSWNDINEKYKGQWVELVAYEWNWNHSSPSFAKVRHASSDRASLMAKVQNSPAVEDSLVLYIGTISRVIHAEDRIASV